MGWEPRYINNIDIWNLRGKSVPMDKLAPKLIRRAMKKNYIAIVIDPIYKIITGDENSADQMAHFCNQFDMVCSELGCAVIYCHHHSKGAQGQKRSMDRASGSGVFARDPDALLDLIELELTDAVLKEQRRKAGAEAYRSFLDRAVPNWREYGVPQDIYSEKAMQDACKRLLTNSAMLGAENARQFAGRLSGWRVDGTLREFPKFEPVNLWFDYPIHRVDESGILGDVDPEDARPPWRQNFANKKSPAERKEKRENSIENAFDCCTAGGEVTVKAMAEYLDVTEKTVRNRLKEHGGFWIDEGKVGRKNA